MSHSRNPAGAESDYLQGNVLMLEGRFDEAAASYERALQHRPDFAEALSNLGVAFAERGNFPDAVARYEQAIRLRPDLAEAHYDLGNALLNLNRFDSAEASYRNAIELRPDWAVAHAHLGATLASQGNMTEALAHLDRAVDLDPDCAEARFTRAQAWLLLGDFARGWPDYEWRWKLPECCALPPHTARWDGSPPSGRTILLRAEQGLGDTLQFVRYAPLVQALGARVLLEAPEPLLPLLARCRGVSQLIARGAPLPDADAEAPLLSLPRLLNTTVQNIPAQVPYLCAAPELVDCWRHRLGAVEGFKVGIAWQGNPGYKGDSRRSIPLTKFAPLARLPGVRLVNLQKGPGTEQLRPIGARFPILDLGATLDVTSGAFMDTAAIMNSLDLVITSDTSIAHLAGGLAVPVWVALSHVPEWRFLLDRDDSPWYPTMRLFRQERAGDWSRVFHRIGETLSAVLNAERSGDASARGRTRSWRVHKLERNRELRTANATQNSTSLQASCFAKRSLRCRSS